jgi:ABC-type branched-subunit amino acid transport system ATPase component
MSALLRVDDLTKKFGGLTAVDRVSFEVEEGQIAGLIGPNGSGKSTTFNLLTGHLLPSAGSVSFAGNSLTGTRPSRVAHLGIARTFQQVRLFKEMTVRDNIRIGQHVSVAGPALRALVGGRRSRVALRRADDQVREIAAQLGIEPWLNESGKNLPLGVQKVVGVARAVAQRPRLLLLDEPAAGLNEEESRQLSEAIRALPGQGITVLIVEHDLDVVFGLCEQVTVLDHGAVLYTGDAAGVRGDASVIAAYLGTAS